jgi:hypothetical protein
VFHTFWTDESVGKSTDETGYSPVMTNDVVAIVWISIMLSPFLNTNHFLTSFSFMGSINSKKAS